MFTKYQMSKNYLRGSKRLAIIQKWLNGKEDDEGKYYLQRKMVNI